MSLVMCVCVSYVYVHTQTKEGLVVTYYKEGKKMSNEKSDPFLKARRLRKRGRVERECK
jgi:hypothetical protein